MDRRSLLLGAAVAAITIPGWNRVFAEGAQIPESKRRLDLAIQAARERGRPLIVIPGSPSSGEPNGTGATWSLYLREGSDRALAELALCEIVCATLDEIRASFPAAAREFGPDAQALLVECRDRSARWIRVNLPAVPPRGPAADDSRLAVAIAQGNFTLEAALHEVLASDYTMVYHRDLEQRAALTAAQRARLSGKLSWNSVLTPTHAELVPALVLLRTRGWADRANLRMLADVAIDRWVRADPTGATWGNETGCAGGPCGMGHIGPLGRRFLRFYSENG